MANRLRSEGLLSSDIEKSDDKPKSDAPVIAEVECWRLRMCALFLVIGTSLQALVVGGQMEALASNGGVSLITFISSLLVFATLLLAMWSLLSQLLLWSDAAVFKLPEHVGLTAKVIKKKKPDAKATTGKAST